MGKAIKKRAKNKILGKNLFVEKAKCAVEYLTIFLKKAIIMKNDRNRPKIGIFSRSKSGEK